MIGPGEIFVYFLFASFDVYRASYTLFQNGRNFSILLFICKLGLVTSFKGKYSFKF